MADLDFAFMSTARVRERVVHDLLIVIDGIEFDVEDLRHLLDEVESDDVVVHSDSTGEMLVKNGVLETLGYQRLMAAATKGPNFEAFKQSLDDLLKKHHPSYN
jgi:hypothetical protein